MKFIYRAVSIDSFIRGDGRSLDAASKASGKSEGMGVFESMLSDNTYGAKLSEVFTQLLNFYGKDDWEFWQTAELDARAVQTNLASALNQSGVLGTKETSRNYPIVIFRKQIEDEEYDSYVEKLLSDNTESLTKNVITDFPESFNGLHYKKIVINEVDVLHFFDNTYGLMKNDTCYFYKSKYFLELAISQFKDYAQISSLGLIKKIKLNE